MLKSHWATMVGLAVHKRNMKRYCAYTLRNVFSDELKREEDTFDGKVKMNIYLANLYKGLEPLN